jgi:hypothetical protein
VDVVVQLNSTFGRDLSALPEDQKGLYEAAYDNATYHWADFRRDVLQALRAYYGVSKVKEGDKSLKLVADAGRLTADIVPALHFRKYQYFYSPSSQKYVDGIKFFTRSDNREVINFPKPHYDNGVNKNGRYRTNGWYKPVVRVLKNARTYMVDNGEISRDLAPSYFLEGFVYNAPDGLFGKSYQHSFLEIVKYFGNSSMAGFTCQNEQLPLFGNSPEQWRIENAVELVWALAKLWDNW